MIFTELQRELGGKILHSLKLFFQSHDLGKASLAYSGGLDSSILLSLCPKTVVPYTLGDDESKDSVNSIGGSMKLGFEAVSIPLKEVDLEKYASIVRDIDPDIRKKDLGYELVLAVLLDQIKEEEVITGQGADEIFYGYSIFRDSPEMDNSIHLKKLYEETLPRETEIAGHFGKKLITPYLSRDIFSIMEDIGRDANFNSDFNKAILRAAATQAGLPLEIVERRKTAAQYGSGMMKKLKSLEIWNSF